MKCNKIAWNVTKYMWSVTKSDEMRQNASLGTEPGEKLNLYKTFVHITQYCVIMCVNCELRRVYLKISEMLICVLNFLKSENDRLYFWLFYSFVFSLYHTFDRTKNSYEDFAAFIWILFRLYLVYNCVLKVQMNQIYNFNRKTFVICNASLRSQKDQQANDMLFRQCDSNMRVATVIYSNTNGTGVAVKSCQGFIAMSDSIHW